MASLLDSVKTLSLNGSVKEVNGDKIAIRNICCVGAGYVGMSPLRLVYLSVSVDRLRCRELTGTRTELTAGQVALPPRSLLSRTLTSRSPLSTET
ncbi:hypothetical protein M431DRAFT_511653 [Trichoderma harzianum CBS 226.95]|uniref:Uncharacterized protein n=1 Tax=Trichoderma harzianum CBS 226.95 TaxID=983964 RepID=A0A2T4A0Z7_TRIHA|nr:hypothetical protein M431DRAFT_511653 [Trichoderma harzianum CBS 226.95]PTB50735.1 hypothetical protein M431DRAFT_511653 [Trichoderma harzianum CBS 226.95]